MNIHESIHNEGEANIFYTSSDEDDEEDMEEKKDVKCPYYDEEHEQYLQRVMLNIAFCHNPKGWKDVSTKDEHNNPITSHYRFITSTSYQMRARMLFQQNHNNIMNYYSYLKSGYNDDDMTWTNKASLNKIIKIFDNDHQIMYNKGDGGFLNYFISPRDTCYIRTRFKRLNYTFKQTKYDIVSSLHYSARLDHTFYYPIDPKCVRVDMKYRGFMLVYNKELRECELIYTAHFDIKGNIPQWLSESGVKNIASNYIAKFNETWVDKIKRLKQRKKQQDIQQMKRWLIKVVGLPQYVDIFIQNGFEDLSYFNTELNEKDLQEMGIKLKGHRIKILSEIKKLCIE